MNAEKDKVHQIHRKSEQHGTKQSKPITNVNFALAVSP